MILFRFKVSVSVLKNTADTMKLEQKIYTVWEKQYRKNRENSITSFVSYLKKRLFSYRIFSTLVVNEEDGRLHTYIFRPLEKGHRFIAYIINETKEERKMSCLRLFDYQTSIDIINKNKEAALEVYGKMITDKTLEPIKAHLLEERLYMIAINLSHLPDIGEERFKILTQIYLKIFQDENNESNQGL